MVERVLGIAGTGPDPLAPPERAPSGRHRRVRARADARLRAALRARPGDGRRAARRRRPVDAAVADDGRRRDAPARVRGWLLGSVAVPGAVGVANRLGLGPVRSDLSAGAIGRAGFEAMADVVEASQIDAEHVIFGHTHRRGGRRRPAGGRSSGTPAAGSTPRACSARPPRSAPTGRGRSASSPTTASRSCATSSTSSRASELAGGGLIRRRGLIWSRA